MKPSTRQSFIKEMGFSLLLAVFRTWLSLHLGCVVLAAIWCPSYLFNFTTWGLLLLSAATQLTFFGIYLYAAFFGGQWGMAIFSIVFIVPTIPFREAIIKHALQLNVTEQMRLAILFVLAGGFLIFTAYRKWCGAELGSFQLKK